jgi:hypothetical protein
MVLDEMVDVRNELCNDVDREEAIDVGVGMELLVREMLNCDVDDVVLELVWLAEKDVLRVDIEEAGAVVGQLTPTIAWPGSTSWEYTE